MTSRLRRSLPLTLLALLGSAILNAAANGSLLQQVRYNMVAPALPDPAITPGDALPVTAKDICTPGYSKKVRNVPQAVKEQAYKNYGITHREKGEYEVDHLISLELGGSNSIKNLWPQSYKTTPWNAHVKDKLENAFHADICGGRLDIKDAQRKISANWIDSYKERFPGDPLAKLPTPAPYNSPVGITGRAPGSPPPAELSDGPAPGTVPSRQVWVNTKSGVYWLPGTRYYGKTKQGKYMSEAEALKAGYRKAGGQ